MRQPKLWNDIVDLKVKNIQSYSPFQNKMKSIILRYKRKSKYL